MTARDFERCMRCPCGNEIFVVVRIPVLCFYSSHIKKIVTDSTADIFQKLVANIVSSLGGRILIELTTIIYSAFKKNTHKKINYRTIIIGMATGVSHMLRVNVLDVRNIVYIQKCGNHHKNINYGYIF